MQTVHYKWLLLKRKVGTWLLWLWRQHAVLLPLLPVWKPSPLDRLLLWGGLCTSCWECNNEAAGPPTAAASSHYPTAVCYRFCKETCVCVCLGYVYASKSLPVNNCLCLQVWSLAGLWWALEQQTRWQFDPKHVSDLSKLPCFSIRALLIMLR